MELRDIPNYEGVYAASAEGDIFRIKAHNRAVPYKIAGRQKRHGYLVAHLCLNARRRDVLAHRAVWTAFYGPIPDGLEINHKNGVKTDNRLENLETCTKGENISHRHRVLGVPPPNNPSFGEQNGAAKLTADDVRAIRRLSAEGVIQKELGQRFGVSQPMIGLIVRREKWRQVS